MKSNILKKILNLMLLSLIILTIFPQTVEGHRDDNKVPAEYIPVYKAAGKEYGLDWEFLAAIHNRETTFSQNVTESSAGALGHMQFMPCTWAGWGHSSCTSKGRGNITKDQLMDPEFIKKYKGLGMDANGDGKADPWDLEDAMFSSAKYLKSLAGSGSKQEQYTRAASKYEGGPGASNASTYGKAVWSYYQRYINNGYDAVEGLGGLDYKGSGNISVSESESNNSRDSSEEGTKDGRPEGRIYFEEGNIANNPNTGVGVGDKELGGQFVNWITKKTEGGYFILLGISWILAAAFLMYICLSILMYVFILKGNSTGYAFSKITRITNPYAEDTVWKLIKRTIVGILFFAFFASGAFVSVMTFLYNTALKYLPFF